MPYVNVCAFEFYQVEKRSCHTKRTLHSGKKRVTTLQAYNNLIDEEKKHDEACFMLCKRVRTSHFLAKAKKNILIAVVRSGEGKCFVFIRSHTCLSLKAYQTMTIEGQLI